MPSERPFININSFLSIAMATGFAVLMATEAWPGPKGAGWLVAAVCPVYYYAFRRFQVWWILRIVGQDRL